WLEQEGAEAAAELRGVQAFARFGHQDDAHRLAHVGLPLRPGEAPVGADARRETDAAPEESSGVHHVRSFLAGKGIGKHRRKNGSHQKMMFNSVMKMISTIMAHRVMIGSENEQLSPRLKESPEDPLPSSKFLRSVALLTWPRNLSEVRKATFF